MLGFSGFVFHLEISDIGAETTAVDGFSFFDKVGCFSVSSVRF